MSKFNPRAAPPPGLFDSDGPTRETHIMSLPVSVRWKAIFLLIDKAGGAALPSVADLDPKDQLKVKWNLLAVVLWPLYYFYLGMWKKGLLAVILALLAVWIGAVLLKGLGFGILIKPLFILPGIYFGRYANVDYYRRMVLGEEDGEWLNALLK
ncbi:MAG TPA: hypothetical protein VFS95_13335 [Telluria sp.]|jgi:hypothetical protein|nr:hypothetical protein [Telluria sp.]